MSVKEKLYRAKRNTVKWVQRTRRDHFSIDGRYAYRMSDKTYLKKVFRQNMGRELNLKEPKTYNEKLQWLKLYDRRPEYTTMVDKYMVKQYVADHIGEKYVIPTLGVWDAFDDIDFDALPNQFVLKCTHDSGGLVICRDKAQLDIENARTKLNKSLGNNYYWSGREWPYKHVLPKIIAEQYIAQSASASQAGHGDEATSISCFDLQNQQGLLDYKFMCFDGKVKVLFLDIGVIGTGTGHAEEYYRNVYERDGTPILVKGSREPYPIPVNLPEQFDEMVRLAETLSKGIPHVRVDLYCLDTGEIKVGEFTFYHGSGLSKAFLAPEWDNTFGSWIELPKRKNKRR